MRALSPTMCPGTHSRIASRGRARIRQGIGVAPVLLLGLLPIYTGEGKK
jgi:hypothetical protein